MRYAPVEINGVKYALTPSQLLALRHAEQKGAFYPTCGVFGSSCGGAIRRMVEHMADVGFFEGYAPFRITEQGRKVAAAYSREIVR